MSERMESGAARPDAVVVEMAIGPSATPGMFTVEVRSPAGDASASVKLDPEPLLARRQELQNALLASAVSARRLLPETERPVREIGEVLFAALLGADEIAGRYRASAALAAERGHRLRVVLRIGDPELAGLPWEAMYDHSTGAYVCRHDHLVRRPPVASVPPPLTAQAPLRILGVVSSPHGLPSLDVGKERDQLSQALAGLASVGKAEIHWAPSATWVDLQALLLDQDWHVLHFIGHGDFDSRLDEGVLALTGEDGRADLVEANRFTDLLRQARPMPRLVVLNSCSGGAAGRTDLFSGTAAALVRSGVTAVTAMQYEISDAAAAAFARGFYTAIAHGRGVDDAVSSGRISILGINSISLEWLTPVLYLRGDHTQLITVPASTTTRPVRPARPVPSGDASDADTGALAHVRTGDRMRKEGRHEEAEIAYRAAIKLDPTLARAHRGLGNSLHVLGRHPEAEGALRQAIRLEPGNARGHALLCATLTDRGQSQEAEAAGLKAIKLDPDDDFAYAALGAARLDQGQHGLAQAACREAIRLNPGYAYAHTTLAAALSGQWQYREAEASCREAIHLSPDYAYAHAILGEALLEMKRYSEAEPVFREVIRLSPSYITAHARLGDVLLQLQKYKEAEAVFREAIRLRPGYAYAHALLGTALLWLGRDPEAEVALREAIRLDPGYAYACSRLASALLRQKKYPEAEAACREAIRLMPRLGYAHARLGDVLLATNRRREAKAAYKKAGL